MTIVLTPLVGNLKHSKFCAELVVVSMRWSECFSYFTACSLHIEVGDQLGPQLMKFRAWGSCHSGNHVPTPRPELQEPQHSSEYLWVWDSMADRPACLLNPACLLPVQRENAAPWSSWKACVLPFSHSFSLVLHHYTSQWGMREIKFCQEHLLSWTYLFIAYG